MRMRMRMAQGFPSADDLSPCRVSEGTHIGAIGNMRCEQVLVTECDLLDSGFVLWDFRHSQVPQVSYILTLPLSLATHPVGHRCFVYKQVGETVEIRTGRVWWRALRVLHLA